MGDVDCERKESRMTPWVLACPSGRSELIGVLIEKHKKEVLETQDYLLGHVKCAISISITVQQAADRVRS